MSGQLIVGIHAVRTALKHGTQRIDALWFDAARRDRRLRELLDEARLAGLRPQASDKVTLDRMTAGANHQGVVAQGELPTSLGEAALDALLGAIDVPPLLLVLDGVTDPHNLGACLRSAEAAGVSAVIVPKDRAVGITPTVRRASAGAADRVPFVASTNLARSLKLLKQSGIWLTGLAGDGDQSLYACDFKGPVAVVIGSEGEGMRRLTRESCDFIARIPMQGSVESLNVSVATGVVLFEVLRQRMG